MIMKTVLYQLTETSKFMMSFVIVTKKNRCIVVDGGRPLDMPLLKQYVGGRKIAAWFLTHPHEDHISGFIDEFEKNGAKDFDIEKVIYNFPSYSYLSTKIDSAPWPEYFKQEITGTLLPFERIEYMLGDRRHVAKQGESFNIDECRIEILYTAHDGLYSNPMNDSSMVFRITGDEKSVLFLGDLGPEGGDILYDESRHLLKSDIVQMAHHGHMNVGMEVYAAIDPEVCLWCCADWLYNEPEIPSYLEKREFLRSVGRERMYGTAVTRSWMERLGVKKHLVTMNGTNEINI